MDSLFLLYLRSTKTVFIMWRSCHLTIEVLKLGWNFIVLPFLSCLLSCSTHLPLPPLSIILQRQTLGKDSTLVYAFTSKSVLLTGEYTIISRSNYMIESTSYNLLVKCNDWSLSLQFQSWSSYLPNGFLDNPNLLCHRTLLPSSETYSVNFSRTSSVLLTFIFSWACIKVFGKHFMCLLGLCFVLNTFHSSLCVWYFGYASLPFIL
jgi:hypothetical protein